MNIVDLSIKRPVMTIMVLAALIIFGVFAYISLPVGLMPEVKSPTVTIQTVYPGASPRIIETQVTKKIEDQVSAIGELEKITAYSMDSVSVVIASFKSGKDENLALQEVKDKVELIISDLPDGTMRPAISKIDIATTQPVMSIILRGDMENDELYGFAKTVAVDRLSQVPGVGRIDLSGGLEREIHVELNRNTVYERSVSAEQIAGILAAANVEIPAGSLRMDEQDIPLRFRGEFTSLNEMKNLDVPTRTGIFKLRQLAELSDSHAEIRERTSFFDKHQGQRSEGALLLQVVKNPSANTINVVRGVQERIPGIEAESGNRVRFDIINEDATFIQDSVDDTLGNMILGVILTGIIIFVFLHDIRSTLIITVAMPFSIISTFLVMQVMHVSVNVVSLLGLSSATGTLVANSVIVLENIFRCKEEGYNRTDSASRGTKQVLSAVFASTLTNIAVFLPLAQMSGAIGMILSDFAITVVISTVFSILVSFTLTPLLASRILPAEIKQTGFLGKRIETVLGSWERAYAASLAFLFKNKRRPAALVLAGVGIFGIALLFLPNIKFELMPKSDGGKIQLQAELPQGSTLEATAAVLGDIESRLALFPEVERILTKLGSLGSLNKDVNVAGMDIFLSPKEARKKNNTDLSAAMIAALADIPGADIRIKPLSELQFSQGAAVDLYLRGPDFGVLQETAGELKARIEAVPGIMNLALSSRAGKAELVFEPDRKRLSEDGISAYTAALAMRGAVEGLVTSTYKDGDETCDIRVTLGENSLRDLEDVKNIPVVSAAGVYPLSRYGNLYFEEGYNRIMRTDKTRTVQITAELLPGYSQGEVLGAVMRAVKDTRLPPGYTVEETGLSEVMGESMQELFMVFVIAILITYMLLASVLESITQPLFILATVPLSLIGVIAGCLLTSTVLNAVAMLGIIMLVGIVVNNAILILDSYNQLRQEGTAHREAMVTAASTKLKAILMSNTAIVLGLLPMALGIGASLSEMRQPMGIVIIGGILSATLLSLWFIPSLEIAARGWKHIELSVKEEEK